MRYSDGRVYITADELSYFAYRRENTAVDIERYGFTKTAQTSSERGHIDYSLTEEERLGEAIRQIADGYAEFIETTHTEIALSKDVTLGETEVTVEGLSDIISYDGAVHTIECVSTVRRFTTDLSPFSEPEFFARASVLAYLFAESAGDEQIRLKLTFIEKKSGERITFTAMFSSVSLGRMFATLIGRAEPFIKRFYETEAIFPTEAEEMPFPYPTIREGQERFVKSAYRAIRKGENLLVSAPTGIGKTMSALFPAVKAIGASSAEKIFYLTAKTVTGRAALDAVKLLSSHAPHLYAVMVLSKEMTCPLKRRFGSPGMQSGCFTCDFVNGITAKTGFTTVSYREREVGALTSLLASGENVFTPEIIRKTADEYSVCPYELSLDLSEKCQVVVCDYNYAIDDNVRFRRYFKKDGNADRYVFLFDEAHNVPDRTRNTYSASITLDTAKELFEEVERDFPEQGSLYDAAVMFVRSLEEIRELCKDNEYLKQTENGEVSCGYFEDARVNDGFAKSVSTLGKQLASVMRDTTATELLGKYYSEIYKLGFVIQNYDEKFRFFCSREGDRLTVELLCLDPSGVLGRMLSSASSVVMFSATLSPMDYFAEVMGMEDAEVIELQSPYEKDNLCLVSYDSVSTRFSDRKATADDIAEVIVSTVSAREGNYIVYFPSYDYMKRVCRSFARIMPDCGIVMQKPGMSYKERQRFIDVFSERRGGTIVGFCVLGGMFSEGIDLAGESLIGALVIGCGMPQLSAERNIMATYYDEKTERGKEFAYTCPGMNKVLQAAGRVIRSETDRGVIVLIDDRLGEPNMKMLFPPHWRHMKYTSNLTSLDAILAEFWENE